MNYFTPNILLQVKPITQLPMLRIRTVDLGEYCQMKKLGHVEGKMNLEKNKASNLERTRSEYENYYFVYNARHIYL